MPAIVRDGDSGTYGGKVKVIQQLLSHADGEPKVATVKDLYVCDKHGPSSGTLMNGCYFNRVLGKPVAIVNVTKASCGCRMKTGSQVYKCCSHLDAKAQRLADREELIAKARDAADDPKRFPNAPPGIRDSMRRSADNLDRLNRDVRYADASVAVYQDPEHPQQFSSGLGGAPEGMIRLSSNEYREKWLPEDLQDPLLWENKNIGYHADLYYDELNGNYIAAFRGTEPKDAQDWIANFQQAHGVENAQYNAAMTLGQRLEANSSFFGPNTSSPGTSNLHITGHSLGGALGSASGIVGSIPYTTFNAAGLHPATVPRFTDGALSNEDGGPLGTRYYTSGDPLTRAQTPEGSATIYKGVAMLGSLGRAFAAGSMASTGGRLPPALGDTVHPIRNAAWETSADAGKLGGGHASLTVVQTIEDQKKQEEAVIKMNSKLEGYYALKDVLSKEDLTNYWKSVNNIP